MGKIIYGMNPSLDGYVADENGDFEWGAPDEELHRVHNDRVRGLAAHLLGRRLYETMVYWETAHEEPDAPEVMLEFAGIWQELPKVVFSTTLDEVVGNSRLEREVTAERIQALKDEF